MMLICSIFKNKQAMSGLVMIGLMVFCAVFAGIISPHDPCQVNLSIRFSPSSLEYPLGTDQLGRCVLSRLIFGARFSLGIAGGITLIVVILSMCLGIFFSYYGGAFDRFFVGICDIFMAFPPLVLVLALVGALGPGLPNLCFSMVLAMWVWYAKVVRTQVLSEKNKNYVLSAKVAGSSDLKIMAKHILPNILPSMIVFFSLGFSDMVLMMSGFSFLGLGVDVNLPEWGAMINCYRKFMYTNPFLMLYPGIFIFITACGFNLLGEALRDILAVE